MASLWQRLKGTSLGYFVLSIGGVRLKNNSGNLQIRNTGDSAFANVEAAEVDVSGNQIVLNSEATESGASWKMNIARPASGMTADVTWTLPSTITTGDFLQTDGSGNLTCASAGSTTMAVKVDVTNLAYGSSSPLSMFTLPANAVIHRIRVIVDTPFSGGTGATMSVGVSGTASKYMGTTDVDLVGASAGDVFEVNPEGIADGSTEALIITYAANSASAGAARAEVFYSIPTVD